VKNGTLAALILGLALAVGVIGGEIKKVRVVTTVQYFLED
jgi:hypothetical protein